MKRSIIASISFMTIAAILFFFNINKKKEYENISHRIIKEEFSVAPLEEKKIETIYLKVNKNREGNRKVIDIVFKMPLSYMNISDYYELDPDVSKLAIEGIQKDSSLKKINELTKNSNIKILKKTNSNFSSFPIIVIYENYGFWIYKTYYLNSIVPH